MPTTACVTISNPMCYEGLLNEGRVTPDTTADTLQLNNMISRYVIDIIAVVRYLF